MITRKKKLLPGLLVIIVSLVLSSVLILNFSKAESCHAATYLPSPSYTITRVTTGVKITWTKVSKATKYKVYKKYNGSWHLIATTASTKSAYIDKTATKCNASYQYTVRAFNSTRKSALSSKGKTITTSHRYKVSSSRAVSCTEKAATFYKCSYCGASKCTIGDTYLKHSYSSWEIVTPASSTSEGLKRRTCSKCGTVVEAPISVNNAIVDKALTYVGNLYKLHGTSYTDGIDCSNFVYNILRDTVGFNRPYRYSSDWLSYGTAVSSINEAQAGDVLVFDGHVAIYMSRGRVIHASKNKPYPEGGVRVDTFQSNVGMIKYFEETRNEKLLGIRRFTELDSSSVNQIQLQNESSVDSTDSETIDNDSISSEDREFIQDMTVDDINTID